MTSRPKARIGIAFAAFAAVVMLSVALAQPKVSGRISGGFQAPSSTDDQGRRHVLKGSTAEPRGKDLYEITEPRVTSYNAQDAPEMFIEAPRCFYEMKQNFAYSDTNLSVRTADGKFAIQGTGWRWNPDAGNLIISNNVVALVQKAALATNLPVNTSATSTTNEPVRITATSFVQLGDTASFIDNVLVQDGPDTLRCDRLNLRIAKPGGIEEVEAVGHFELKQAEAAVRSGRAVYDLKENIIRISEKPRWEAEGRAGTADLFTLDRDQKELLAEGNVYMRLPLTNLTEASAPPNPPADTNRFLEVYADKFRFLEATSNRFASAFYQGRVRALYTGATILADAVTVGFNATNRIERILAERDVVIDSRGNKAFGARAEYELIEDKIVLSGEPRWELERATGRSDTLVFYPKTREILALKNVEMILPGQSVGGMFGVNAPTNTTAPTPLVINAQLFSRATNVAVFHENVVATDARGRMSCGTMTLAIGASNQVERILVEHNVRIEQQGFTGTGQRGDYNAATGLFHLTGDPLLVSDDKTLRADAFFIDRNANTFSVAPGRYRIEMKMKQGAGPISLSPVKR